MECQVEYMSRVFKHILKRARSKEVKEAREGGPERMIYARTERLKLTQRSAAHRPLRLNTEVKLLRRW